MVVTHKMCGGCCHVPRPEKVRPPSKQFSSNERANSLKSAGAGVKCMDTESHLYMPYPTNSSGTQMSPHPREGRGCLSSESELDCSKLELKHFPIREVDIQVMLVLRLNKMGYQTRCEARLPSRHHRSGWMRVDIVVFWQTKIFCLIEVKRSGKKQISTTSRQRFAYRDSGYTTYYCIGQEDIAATLDCIKRQHKTIAERLIEDPTQGSFLDGF